MVPFEKEPPEIPAYSVSPADGSTVSVVIPFEGRPLFAGDDHVTAPSALFTTAFPDTP